jgi:transglutaminase-like putative cysteine protease
MNPAQLETPRKLKRRRTIMTLDRRDFIKAGAALSVMSALPRGAQAQATFDPKPSGWRNYQVVTRLEIAKPEGKVQAWIPVPSVNEADWFRSGDSRWTTNGKAQLRRDAKYGAGFVHVEWDENEPVPAIEVTSSVAAQDRFVDLGKPAKGPALAQTLSDADRKLYTAATALIPIDGIVKTTSDKIAGKAGSDVEKAQKIYDWIVENTFRSAKTRGCGIGDVAAMLTGDNLHGKCADLNALFVGLARAQGIPARDVYGIRLAPSKFGYKSLGAGSEAITRAQHCRAEVYLGGLGWVPVDPADVRKVILEEPPANLAIDDPKVVAARKALFGAWEGNWLAYNFAHDVQLPGAKGPALEFLMYPQAETAAGRLDCLDPDTFKYSITSKEVNV